MKNNKLKVGDLFMVSMRDIGFFYLSLSGSFMIDNIYKKSGKYDNVYFLLKYIGDNLCEEYYTGKLIQISYPIYEPDYYITKYAWYNSFWTLDKLHDKWKLFQELDKYILEYPLVIEPNKISYIESEKLFNNGEKGKVKENITYAFRESKLLYLNSKNKYLSKQYEEAYVEYMKDDFSKRKINSKVKKMKRG